MRTDTIKSKWTTQSLTICFTQAHHYRTASRTNQFSPLSICLHHYQISLIVWSLTVNSPVLGWMLARRRCGDPCKGTEAQNTTLRSPISIFVHWVFSSGWVLQVWWQSYLFAGEDDVSFSGMGYFSGCTVSGAALAGHNQTLITQGHRLWQANLREK